MHNTVQSMENNNILILPTLPLINPAEKELPTPIRGPKAKTKLVTA